MPGCAVYGCSHDGIRCKYFKFPKVTFSNFEDFELVLKRRSAWFQALRRSDITEREIDHKVICRCHFTSGKPAQLLETDNVDWIPTRKIPQSEEDTDTANKSSKKKLIKKFSRVPGKPYTWSVESSSNSENIVNNVPSVASNSTAVQQTPNPSSIRATKSVTLVDAQTQTDITGDYFDQLKIKTAQLLHLRHKVVAVKLTKINPQQYIKNVQNVSEE